MGESIESLSREQTLDDEGLLLHEFYHRINNEFASVIGMVSLACARVVDGEAKIALERVKHLLQSYAQVHHALQMPGNRSRVDVAGYLHEICEATRRSKLDTKGIDLIVTGGTAQMEADRCWRLGLIVSELVTNAARHAFKEHGGLIRDELRATTKSLQCRVIDNGVGIANVRAGSGLKILRALARGLGGTIEQWSGPHGTTSVVLFPMIPSSLRFDLHDPRI
jgi:two-component sensor histidine kinase